MPPTSGAPSMQLLPSPLRHLPHLPQLALANRARGPCPGHCSFWARTPPSPSSSQRSSQCRAQEQRRGFPARTLWARGTLREPGWAGWARGATENKVSHKRECRARGRNSYRERRGDGGEAPPPGDPGTRYCHKESNPESQGARGGLHAIPLPQWGPRGDRRREDSGQDDKGEGTRVTQRPQVPTTHRPQLPSRPPAQGAGGGGGRCAPRALARRMAPAPSGPVASLTEVTVMCDQMSPCLRTQLAAKHSPQRARSVAPHTQSSTSSQRCECPRGRTHAHTHVRTHTRSSPWKAHTHSSCSVRPWTVFQERDSKALKERFLWEARQRQPPSAAAAPLQPRGREEEPQEAALWLPPAQGN